MHAWLWALTGAVLWPVLIAQGRWARARTPRLPEAQGPARGAAGQGPALRLVVIGESPVAGVGVEHYEDSMGAQLARALGARLGRTVQWTALGENGADAAGVLARLAPKLTPCDCAVITLGVNDTTRFTPLARWRERMEQLIAAVRLQCAGPIVVAGVPPMGRFTALPQPLRAWIGLRARLLDAELRALCEEAGVLHLQVPALVEPAHLARDGYHPSSEGVAAWVEGLAGPIVAALAP